MTVTVGVFLIVHGLIHIAVWLAPQQPDAPFDSRHSWLLGDVSTLSRSLAGIACVLLVLAGILVLLEVGPGAALAIAGAVVSLVLVLLTFNRWLSVATAINAAIILIALDIGP